jgi:hypothetical protein
MASGEPAHPNVNLLVRRLLPSQANGEPARPQPVVVLLGPVGAGKTRALESVRSACGSGTVHACFDFDSAPTASTVEVLAALAFEFAQEWTARPPARFARFTLGLTAVQAPLTRANREADRKKLADLINCFARNRSAERIADSVTEMISRTIDVNGGQPYGDIAHRVLPTLVGRLARKRLGAAKKWHADYPAANGAEPLDALLTLRRATLEHLDVATEWLTEAFLADVRESHLRLSRPDPGSPCSCVDTDWNRHRHNWLVLLDNIDQPAGTAFVQDLVAARDRHQQARHGEYDALLVLATSGRWDARWEARWVAPWKSEPVTTGTVRTVPPADAATYAYWAAASRQEPPAWRFPVLLEPLPVAAIAAILGVEAHSPVCRFVQRATAGLPGAVHHLAGCLPDRRLRPGARDVLSDEMLSGEVGEPAGSSRWLQVLKQARLTDHLSDLDLDDFVTAAPFATAPWLVPHDAATLTCQPSVGRILTELRTAMWVSGPDRGAVVTGQACLHPWIGRALVAALVQRDAAANWSYAEQFRALLADSGGDPVREAYCQLALGEIGDVVDLFGRTFDAWPHQEWVERLNLVVSVPDELPRDRTSAELYDELVRKANRHAAPGPLTHTIARLVVASWLAADTFARPDPAQLRIIEHCYRELAPKSPRSDVSALHLAGEQATALGR